MTVSPGAALDRPRRQSRGGDRPLRSRREFEHEGWDWASSTFRPPWRWWYALAALFVSHGLAFALEAALYLSGVRHYGVGRSLALSVGVIEIDAFMIAAAWLFASRTCVPRLEHFGLRRPVGRKVGRAIALAWFGGRVAAVIGALLTPANTSTPRAHGTVAIALGALAAVVVAPVVEEVFFRGFFYGALRNRIPIAPAAIASGLVFGAVHLLGNGYSPGIALGIGLNGVIWCLLYEYTGSLWPSILLHSYMNASITAARYAPSLLLPALIAFVVGIFVLRRTGRRSGGLRTLRRDAGATA